MAHPDWVLKYKEKGTCICCIRGYYYLYAYSTKWCPIKKRAKKVTGKCLGRITEKDGFIPSGTKVPCTLMNEFQKLQDPRSSRLKMYPLVEILLISFLSVLCGGEGFADMENFGKLKLSFLQKFYAFKNGTPSDDTFRRFFSKLNPDQFKEIFAIWGQSLSLAANAKVIAIDGKASRHTFDKDTNMLHTVSAYAANVNLVFGQEKVDDKSNEITAIPKLLDLIDIKGAVVTIDAMGCQFLIADLIKKKKADYVFSLKGNQGSLCDDITLFMMDKDTSVEMFTHHDKGHGRIESRTCSVSTDVKWIHERHEKWKSIQSVIKIESVRDLNGNISQETRFYIASCKKSAKEMLEIIRSHWAIENNLHWVLDMTFHEDQSRIRKGNSPLIMTMMRHVAINLLTSAKGKRQSIKSLMKMCALDENFLLNVIRQNLPS